MNQVAASVMVAVVCSIIDMNFGSTESDANRLNGKTITVSGYSNAAVKSAIPYSDGHLEVTVWFRSNVGHHSVLGLLKKSSEKAYDYEAGGFHLAINGVSIAPTDTKATEPKNRILRSINAALDSTVPLINDKTDSGTYNGDSGFKEVVNKLRTDKTLEVNGVKWNVVGATIVSSTGMQVGGRLVFVAKYKDETTGKHYSNLVVAEHKGQKISVKLVLPAENGKQPLTMDDKFANGETIAEALNKLIQFKKGEDCATCATAGDCKDKHFCGTWSRKDSAGAIMKSHCVCFSEGGDDFSKCETEPKEQAWIHNVSPGCM